jgi:hypothetical protein
MLTHKDFSLKKQQPWASYTQATNGVKRVLVFREFPPYVPPAFGTMPSALPQAKLPP